MNPKDVQMKPKDIHIRPLDVFIGAIGYGIICVIGYYALIAIMSACDTTFS